MGPLDRPYSVFTRIAPRQRESLICARSRIWAHSVLHRRIIRVALTRELDLMCLPKPVSMGPDGCPEVEREGAFYARWPTSCHKSCHVPRNGVAVRRVYPWLRHVQDCNAPSGHATPPDNRDLASGRLVEPGPGGVGELVAVPIVTDPWANAGVGVCTSEAPWYTPFKPPWIDINACHKLTAFRGSVPRRPSVVRVRSLPSRMCGWPQPHEPWLQSQ